MFKRWLVDPRCSRTIVISTINQAIWYILRVMICFVGLVSSFYTPLHRSRSHLHFALLSKITPQNQGASNCNILFLTFSLLLHGFCNLQYFLFFPETHEHIIAGIIIKKIPRMPDLTTFYFFRIQCFVLIFVEILCIHDFS